jgi:hypothetical protein
LSVSDTIARATGLLLASRYAGGIYPLLLRAATRNRIWRTVASIAALAGSLLTRIGWIEAGRASSRQKP